MKLTKQDWEKVKSEAEEIIKSLTIQLIHAELMFNKASIEVNDAERFEKRDGKDKL